MKNIERYILEYRLLQVLLGALRVKVGGPEKSKLLFAAVVIGTLKVNIARVFNELDLSELLTFAMLNILRCHAHF